MKKELWKDIPNYEGLYQASNYGRIRSIDRYVKSPLKNQEKVLRKGKIIKPYKNKKGYLLVVLSINNKHKTWQVHRLVANAYIPNLHNYKEINHKDEDKTNNHVDNLEWCTSSYNINYGERNNKVAKKISKPVICLELNIVFDSSYEVEKQLGIFHGNVSNCCKGKAKTAGGYHWKYKDTN